MKKRFLIKFDTFFQKSALTIWCEMLLSALTIWSSEKHLRPLKPKLKIWLGRPKAGLADLEHFFQTSNLDFEATTNVKYISIHENYMSLPPVDSPDPKEQLSYV